MGKISIVILYVLWFLAIISLLVTTFTNFEYSDLNMIAFALLAFAFVNSFFAMKKF